MTTVYTLLADVRDGARHWTVTVEIDGGPPAPLRSLGPMSTAEALCRACAEIGGGVQPIDWVPGEGTGWATRWTLTVDMPAHHRTH